MILETQYSTSPETKFKEFEPWLKYGWFHLKLYSMFQDISRRPIGGFEMQLKLIKFGFWYFQNMVCLFFAVNITRDVKYFDQISIF